LPPEKLNTVKAETTLSKLDAGTFRNTERIYRENASLLGAAALSSGFTPGSVVKTCWRITTAGPVIGQSA